MIKISVVIITFNEELNIARCIESVKDLADEIVVVDSCSTDRTREICEGLGVTFIEHAFEGYIRQKNYASTCATYPIQLSLDADEAVSAALRGEIMKVKENWQYDGYEMNRLTNYCGHWIRHGGWYPDTKLRLYDAQKGGWTGIDPHDKLEMESGCSVGYLKGDILHYSYYTLDDHYRQVEHFSTISARELVKRGKPVFFFKLFLNPLVKFIRMYFFQLGWMDGAQGFTICRISAIATYRKYNKAIRMRREQRKNTPIHG